VKQLRDAGFTGDKILIAGHSLGGVMAQNYANDNKDVIKGQVLMGSVLTRGKREIKADGTTHFNYDVPTLTIGGTKDGLMRVSRLAESYWHSYTNVDAEQKDLFPVVALEGVAHMGFTSGEPPKAVAERDLTMEVDEAKAHQDVATVMVQFMDQIIMGNKASIDTKATETVLAPLVEAMELEGFYNLKQPCYASPTINPTDPTCLHGAPWHN
jgi:poly(3-hydroxybutyrate) depolymerase